MKHRFVLILSDDEYTGVRGANYLYSEQIVNASFTIKLQPLNQFAHSFLQNNPHFHKKVYFFHKERNKNRPLNHPF